MLEAFHMMSEKAKSAEKGIAALKGATDPVMVSEGIIKI